VKGSRKMTSNNCLSRLMSRKTRERILWWLQPLTRAKNEFYT